MSATDKKTPIRVSPEPLRVNLGCCDSILPGYLNLDRVYHDGVDVVSDLTTRWPFETSTVDELLALDIIEHLPDKIHTMNEAWRVLRPGGRIQIEVPTTEGPGAFQDPTHVSYWNRRSFLYYEAGNPYRERFAQSYGIHAAFKVAAERMTMTMDGPKLSLVLEAVK